jgi:hypothetical protein
LLPEDGSDVNFRVRDFSISIPLESLVEDKLQALSGQLRSMTANAVLKLLAAPLSVEHE